MDSIGEQRFRSALDTWILAVILLSVAVQVWALWLVGSTDVSTPVRVSTFILLGGSLGLTMSLLLNTVYVVGNESLRIIAGPFRWTIARSEVARIEPSTSWLSSPALSLDRLCIHYGNGKRILVSPADKRAFVEALGVVAEQPEDGGTG